MILTDMVFLTADDTNVYDQRLGGKVQPWARRVRIQVCSSDYDTTFSCVLGGQEMARDSGPHVLGADNLGIPEWTKPHIQSEIRGAPTDFEILVNLNIVTAGSVLIALQQES